MTIAAIPTENRDPKNSDKTIANKQRMLEALEKTLGIVSPATRLSGISRATHYHWLGNDPEYRAKVSEMTDLALDFVESSLLKQISKGNVTAIIFYLKTKGQVRGYGQGKHSNYPKTELDSLTDEELLNIIIK